MTVRLFYIICLVLMIIVFFSLKRFTESPFGRVLVVDPENEQWVDIP